MQKIDDLQLEIKSFETEIQKLQAELTAGGGFTMKLATSTAPSEIARSIRTEAQQVLERQPAIKGIRDAIAELNSRLQPKKVQLGELEAQELKQERSRRVEEGRSRLRAKLSDVQQAAEALKPLFFELKAIALEYEKDFGQVHPPSSGEKQLNRASLLNYEPIFLPQLTEVSDRFILHSKSIDLFKSEKEALKRQRLQQSLAWRQNHDEEVAQAQQRRVDEEMLVARKERESFIDQKQEQLKTLINQRGWELNGQAATNPSTFDRAIAKLKEEIENLDKIKQE